METKPLSVDDLAIKFGNDIIDYLHRWMRDNYAEDTDFHRYRMRLLTSFADAESTSEKLIMLSVKISPSLKFRIMELVSDKIMGESMARYIFAKIMIKLNQEYKKILEFEADKVGAEINNLNNRVTGLSAKIGQH